MLFERDVYTFTYNYLKNYNIKLASKFEPLRFYARDYFFKFLILI